MELHYSQTRQRRFARSGEFETPMELHYSQTFRIVCRFMTRFETPMELHYSQTSNSPLQAAFAPTHASKSMLTAYVPSEGKQL